jgi:hypothetical protein
VEDKGGQDWEGKEQRGTKGSDENEPGRRHTDRDWSVETRKPGLGGAVSVVLSLYGWRGPPPTQWNTRRMKIRHDQLGGVTEGEFTVHITYKGELAGFNWCANLKGVPEQLMHVLECTGTGRKVPIPTETPKGWTLDGHFKWEDRFNKVMTPTVFDKHRMLDHCEGGLRATGGALVPSKSQIDPPETHMGVQEHCGTSRHPHPKRPSTAHSATQLTRGHRGATNLGPLDCN